MKLLILIGLSIALMGCGSGSKFTPQTAVKPGQAFTVTLVGSYDTASHPGISVAAAAETITLPQPSDIVVLANTTEFYHANLNVGTVSCDYIHQAGATQFTTGAGCTTGNPTVTLNQSDTLSLSIGSGVTQQTTAQITLQGVFK